MITFESRNVRRVVGRLERGDHVKRSLEEIARERHITTGWVQAIGILSTAEVRRYDPRHKRFHAPERIEAPCEIVSLGGNVSLGDGGSPEVHLEVTLRRDGPAGAVLLAGELLEGEAFHLELVVECYDDLGLRREPDPDTGLELWQGMSSRDPRSSGRRTGPDRAGPDDAWGGTAPPDTLQDAQDAQDPQEAEPPAPGGPVSWGQVAKASASPRETGKHQKIKPGMGRPSVLKHAREPAPVPDPIPTKARQDIDELLDQPLPERGDWVDHKVFGLCRVEGEDANGGVIIKLPTGARKHINLEVLQVLPARIEGDRRVYPLRPRRR